MADKRRERPPVSEYQQKLRDPRWQRRRLEIMERDQWRCQICFNDGETLHVHHRYYEQETEPWEYMDVALVTLCATCHEKETNARREAEEWLLRSLYDCELFSHHLLRLVSGFMYWEQVHMVDVMVDMLAWALGEKEIMDELLERYFDDLKERHPVKFEQGKMFAPRHWRKP